MPFTFLLALAAGATASATTAAPAPADYANPQNWLCRPDRRDACSENLRDVTQIAADGTMTVQKFVPATAPKADCFYVYPTVSYDRTPNSDMIANDEERRVVALQFARFGSVCRTFAPLYRQGTLTALRAALVSGKPSAADTNLAYGDVLAAWRHYLANDNGGRPFVLVGHSQGSSLLRRLIASEIDGKPVAARMLSAMISGTNVVAPKGQDVGGDFKAVPACRSARQTGCVIAYVSFRASTPPPPNSRFGVATDPAMAALCTNPAALGGGKATLKAVFPAINVLPDMVGKIPPWTSDNKPITTADLTLPGLLSGECSSTDNANYLAVTINADPADPRTDTITGDSPMFPDWGLHVIDVSVAQDDLVGLVSSQLSAWEAKR